MAVKRIVFNIAADNVSDGRVDEPWDVRRFYMRDPFGRLVNILSNP